MRWKWIVGICVFLILTLMVTVYAVLATYDYNKLKPRVTRMVKDATGRELNLGGKVNLSIGFSPSLVVTDVTLGNASWGSQPQMITVEKLQAQVRLLPLLFKHVEVKHIGLAGVDVLLETDPDGQGNWDFITGDSSAGKAGAFKPKDMEINNVRIDKFKLLFREGKTGSTKRFTLTSLDLAKSEAQDEFTLELKANYNGQRVTLSGKTGLIRYLFTRQRFPLELSGTLSNAKVRIAGAIDDILNLQGIDLKANVAGTDLAALGFNESIQLPRTSAFEATGLLKGSKESLALNDASGNLSASGNNLAFSGSVGDLIAPSGIDLKLNVSGNDLSEVGAIIEEKLPATDEFAVEGRLTGSAKALSLKEVQGSTKQGSLSVVCNGEVKDLIAFSGLDLQLKASGKNLAEVGKIIDVELPATDEFAVEGRLMGSAKTLSLQKAHGQVKQDNLNLNVNGAVKDLLTLGGMDLQFRLTGQELAEIGPFFGAELPELGLFDVSGELSGSAKAISLNEFTAIIDKSDFKGMAKVEFRKRHKITVRLESSVIDFTALMKSLEKEAQKPANKDKQKRLLFSDDPLPFDVLKKVDADILLKARNIHAKDARLDFGHMALKLEDHDFSIDKLEATFKETKISGSLQINAGTPSQVSTHFVVQNFNLGDFLKETGKSDQVRAVVDIAAHGKSKGDSVRGLMANLDGSIGAVMGEGYLTKYLDLLSVGLSQEVVHFWKPSKAVDQIKCAVLQFDVKEGVAASKAFVFNTRAGLLSGEGKINLGTEQVNFLLVPKPKHPSLILSTKLRVSGTVMEPKVSPDTVSLLTKGAEALSSLAVGPLALLAPFVHLGANKNHPCDVQSIGQLGLQSPAPE